MSLAIHWFRRDLRLTDNTALNAAAAAYDQVLPVYILSDWKREHRWTGPPRQEFLCGSLRELASKLERAGSRLVIRQGANQVAVLEELVRESGAEAIYFNNDPDPHGRAVEGRLRAMAARAGIQVRGFDDCWLHAPGKVLTGAGKPYKVFAPFARAWTKLERPDAGRTATRLTSPSEVRSLPLPTLGTWGLSATAEILPPGETAARKRLDRFIRHRICTYVEHRNIPGLDGTSRISQDLRWGLLSIREVVAQCREAGDSGPAEARRNMEIFLNELAWREFAFQVLWHIPEVLEREFLPQFRQLEWTPPGARFKAWQEGRTGFPIVDAGMRQLTSTGFVHNRVRMIVAMFLCKDLHHSWKLGESFFMQHLVDGEIANNNTGWQWCASVGTDAQPYFRIQNPWSQTARFDPDGEYIKRWVPELRDVPARKFCSPPADGERLAKGYPLPIVDHAAEREVTLKRYREASDAAKRALVRPLAGAR
jgi:deoxyribodipyrimidine photo-lyase